MGSTVGGSDVVVDLWADVFGKSGLVKVVVLEVDLILRLRHLVSVGFGGGRWMVDRGIR